MECKATKIIFLVFLSLNRPQAFAQLDGMGSQVARAGRTVRNHSNTLALILLTLTSGLKRLCVRPGKRAVHFLFRGAWGQDEYRQRISQWSICKQKALKITYGLLCVNYKPKWLKSEYDLPALCFDMDE